MALKRPRKILFFLCFFLPFLSGFGQSDPTGKRAVTRTYLIRNATLIIDPKTTQTGQDVLFSDGIIKAVGKNLKFPPEAEIIQGDSLYVYPGFIDMANKRGVSTPPAMEKPKNFDSSKPEDYLAGIHPEVSVLNHFNPAYPQISEWRKLGFTLAQVIPMGMGMLPGNSALVGYDNSDKSALVVKERSSVYARFSAVGGMYPSNNLGIMAKFRDLFENARVLDVHLARFNSNVGVSIPEKNPVLENLIPLVKAQKPVYFETNSALDVGRALRLKKEFGFDLILGGISEGEEYLNDIKNWNVGVALSLNLPVEPDLSKKSSETGGEFERLSQRVLEAYEDRLSLPAKFEAAGIPFGFTTKQLASDKFLSNLRIMIAHGLSEEAALAALTVNAAKLLKVDQLTGDIKAGKMANFVVTTRPIFDPEVQISQVIVNGQVFEYEKKEKKENADTKTAKTEVWRYQASTPSGKAFGDFSLWQESGKWVGEITIDDPEKPGHKTILLENVRKTATMMSFGLTLRSGDRDIRLNVKGDVSSNSFSGIMDIMGNDRFPFNAKKTDKPNI
ncbi:hypothetical protein ADIS_1404 [Lunatimonas lonarensis]|uniref:Amidohydrolase-related domain-containing protein n=1 Tax=Lunatimonas lonarensis TaxID=1232681 RepID=R7ZVU5_9BACT|nr:amidohydrolase family protein [Lunatimonas lonarensis]EON78207.1 hypothetical protein ADIS_1404 [Lunatimonas lonarensis]